MRPIVPAIAVALYVSVSFTAAVHAAPITFNLVLSGEQESDAGDPDGFAFGTLTIDPEPGIYGLVSWNLTYGNISEPSAMHVHKAPLEVAGPVVIPMGVATSGGPNTLIGFIDDNNWPGQYLKSDLEDIIANPQDYYLNIHTEEFNSGAVRAQLPEPASAAVIAGAGLMMLARRRR